MMTDVTAGQTGGQVYPDPKPTNSGNPDPVSGSGVTDTVETLSDAGPEPLLAGTFALYPEEGGGLVLVTEIAGRGVERRAFPAKMVRAAAAFMAGGGGMFGALFGRG